MSAWSVGHFNRYPWGSPYGDVAQLARAPALQAGGRGFESHRLHSLACSSCSRSPISIGLYGLNEFSCSCRLVIFASFSRTSRPFRVPRSASMSFDRACSTTLAASRSAAGIDFA